jgi:hypothetical protein
MIALFALSIGGYPIMLKLLSYFHFPPARFYYNAIRAIERLEALNDIPSTPSRKGFKQGIINSSDMGFKELTKILQKNRMLIGEADEIILGEVDIGGGISTGSGTGFIPLTPQKVRFLGIIQKGEQIELQKEQFDPSRITRDLMNQAEEITRKSVGNYLVGLVFLYMIAGIYLVITT